MYYLRTRGCFDSAHFLKNYDGKCRNIHGHRWEVIAELGSEELETEGQREGMVVDFSELKGALNDICEVFDHSLISEEGALSEKTLTCLDEEGFRVVTVPFRPTAENFAKYFFDRLKENYPVKRVEVYETPTNFAAYEET